MPRPVVAILILLVAWTGAPAQEPASAMFGRLAVNQTHIVFTYALRLCAKLDDEAQRHTRRTSQPEASPKITPTISLLSCPSTFSPST